MKRATIALKQGAYGAGTLVPTKALLPVTVTKAQVYKGSTGLSPDSMTAGERRDYQLRTMRAQQRGKRGVYAFRVGQRLEFSEY